MLARHIDRVHAPASAGPPRDGERERSRLACDQCRKRKLRCNDERPCEPCLLKGLTCSMSSTSRPTGRPRNSASTPHPRTTLMDPTTTVAKPSPDPRSHSTPMQPTPPSGPRETPVALSVAGSAGFGAQNESAPPRESVAWPNPVHLLIPSAAGSTILPPTPFGTDASTDGMQYETPAPKDFLDDFVSLTVSLLSSWAAHEFIAKRHLSGLFHLFRRPSRSLRRRFIRISAASLDEHRLRSRHAQWHRTSEKGGALASTSIA